LNRIDEEIGGTPDVGGPIRRFTHQAAEATPAASSRSAASRGRPPAEGVHEQNLSRGRRRPGDRIAIRAGHAVLTGSPEEEVIRPANPARTAISRNRQVRRSLVHEGDKPWLYDDQPGFLGTCRKRTPSSAACVDLTPTDRIGSPKRAAEDRSQVVRLTARRVSYVAGADDAVRGCWPGRCRRQRSCFATSALSLRTLRSSRRSTTPKQHTPRAREALYTLGHAGATRTVIVLCRDACVDRLARPARHNVARAARRPDLRVVRHGTCPDRRLRVQESATTRQRHRRRTDLAAIAAPRSWAKVSRDAT